MEYGLIVTTQDTEKFDKAKIEWMYWDAEAMLLNRLPKRFEVIFESETDRNKAKRLLMNWVIKTVFHKGGELKENVCVCV